VPVVEYDLDRPGEVEAAEDAVPATCPRCGKPTEGKVRAIAIPRREAGDVGAEGDTGDGPFVTRQGPRTAGRTAGRKASPP
jgi:hypothetical protein